MELDMERVYQDGIKKDVQFFTGIEVERTPAFGMKTLFVCGIHPIQEILDMARNNHCEHIYLGANQSFDPGDWQTGHHRLSDAWNKMIMGCLDSNIMVTLDFDVAHCEWVHEGGYSEHRNFIPQISIKLPYIQLFNYNATLKIDDKDFKFSNPGVWCHSLHDLQSRSTFTDWKEYERDQTL
jgi:hypothetical protein